MSKRTAALLTVGLWGFYLLLSPLCTSILVLFPVVAYYLLHQNKSAATLILLLGSALADLTVPQMVPQYFIVSLVASVAYLELIDVHLAPTNVFTNTLGLIAWLLTWRLIYLLELTMGRLLIHGPLLNPGALVEPILMWLGSGTLVWGIMLGTSSLYKRHRRKSQMARVQYYG